jgi:hypothetical protein
MPDWLPALPSGNIGLWILFAIALIGFVLSLLDRLSGRGKRKVRENLGRLLLEGRQLAGQCSNEKEPAPEAVANEWATETEAYLTKHLGSDYVASFRSAAGLPLGVTSIASQPHRDLEAGLKVRLARLQQFMEQLRR